MKFMKYIYPKGTRFGEFGGQFVPEILLPALRELEREYKKAKRDKRFQRELNYYLKVFAGRPTPLYFAENLTKKIGGAKIYLKREDLAHTGAHKINNTIGQALLAKYMRKKRVIAETGAGQHGVATASACALFGLQCEVYMGAVDMRRQALNVFRMRLLGAKVREVKTGSQTLKDAINDALRDWITNIKTTYYLLGSVVGPHPYPLIVRDFQKIIGEETKKEIMKRESRLPDALIACVGGGSNSIGLFYPFINEKVRLIGVEAGGDGNKHAASICAGKRGVLHGTFSYILQNKNGQILETHSISAGLDYPGVGPEHAFLHSIGRAEYTTITDKEALRSFALLSKLEGIVPALESAHALAYAEKLARKMDKENIVVVCLSGRGDKDMEIVKRFYEK